MNAAPPLTLAIAALVSAALAGLLIFLGEKANSRNFEGQLYSLKTPDGESADTEQFFVALAGMLPSMQRSRSAGRAFVSLEITGRGQQVRYLLWIPKGQEDFVRSLLGATHPGIELSPEEDDPLAAVAPVSRAASARLNFQPYLPIRTKFDQEPLATLLATIARAGEDETVHFSVLARPRASGWQRVARSRAYQLRHPSPSVWPGPGTATSPTPFGVEQAKAIESKAAFAAFDCNVRVVIRTQTEPRARELLRSVAASLRQFDAENSIRFQRWFIRNQRVLSDAVGRRFHRTRSMLLTTPELAALWHLPKDAPRHVDSVRSPKLPAPAGLPSQGRLLGTATFPEQDQQVRISVEDSRRHLHVLGPTGTGKTTLLANLALQDITTGRGVAVIDPKGDLVTAILDRFPRERAKDLVLISPEDLESSIGINPLEYSEEWERDLVADNIFSIVKRLYASSWGPRTADVFLSSLTTILRTPTPTLADILALLTDSVFRRQILDSLDDPGGIIAWFWSGFEALSPAQRAEVAAPIQNKLRALVARPRIRRLLCQSHSNVDMRKLIDSKGVLLVNLSTGQWGQETSSLLGSFLVAKLWQAVRARADTPENQRPDFSLYIDEFQEYMAGAGSFADALAMARSFHLSLTLANQHLGQLPKEVVSALSSNARSRVTFQCGQDDSRYLSREFAPLDAQALMNLPRHEMAARVSIDGETSAAFTAHALSLAPPTDPGVAKFVADVSSRKFARPAADIDAELRSHLEPTQHAAPTHGVGRRSLDQT